MRMCTHISPDPGVRGASYIFEVLWPVSAEQFASTAITNGLTVSAHEYACYFTPRCPAAIRKVTSYTRVYIWFGRCLWGREGDRVWVSVCDAKPLALIVP